MSKLLIILHIIFQFSNQKPEFNIFFHFEGSGEVKDVENEVDNLMDFTNKTEQSMLFVLLPNLSS